MILGVAEIFGDAWMEMFANSQHFPHRLSWVRRGPATPAAVPKVAGRLETDPPSR